MTIRHIRFRNRDRIPFNFVDGLMVSNVDVGTIAQLSTQTGASTIGCSPVGLITANDLQTALSQIAAHMANNVNWTLSTASTVLATTNSSIFADTRTSAVSVILPTSPSMGDSVRIADGFGNANVNNITINPNGLKIIGSTNNYVLNTKYSSIELVYFNSDSGWLLSKCDQWTGI